MILNNKDMKNNIFLALVGKFIGSLGIFIIFSLSAKTLSVNQFANFSLIMSIFPSFVTLLTFGQDIASSKFLPSLKSNKILIYNIITTMLFSLSILSIFFFFFIKAGYIYNIQFDILIYLIFIIIFSSILRAISDYSRAVGKYTNFILFNSMRSSGGLILWILFLIFFLYFYKSNSMSVANIFFSLFISCLISCLIFFTFNVSKKSLFNNLKLFISTFSFNKRYTYQSFLLMIYSLIIIVRFDHDIWILNFVGSKIDVALYTSIIKIASLIMVPMTILESLIPQKISKFFNEKNFYELENLIRSISTKIFFLSSAAILAIFFFSNSILYYVFGESFLEASHALKILALGFILPSILGPCSVLLLLTRYQNYLLFVNLFSTLFSFVCGYFMVLNFGYLGMVYTFLICINLVHLSLYYLTKKLLKIETIPRIF